MSATTSAAAKARVLCVDDEPNVLEGLALHLRRRYEVALAKDGPAALAELARLGGCAVVVSDMRMPGMDGATLLARVRHAYPDSVRILLTGQADLESSIKAVNEGQIFRYLTKPCPPPTLLAAVEAAVELNRLVTSERVLLEQTLRGSIQALTEVLALTNPLAFGRATRVKGHVLELAARLALAERWQVEVAAMLSQLGCITLPPETVEKLYYGKPLLEAEQELVARLPLVTEHLLAKIPRLELVRAMLLGRARGFRSAEPPPADAAARAALRGAQVLKVVSDFDELETQGNGLARAFDVMRGRADTYDPEVLRAYAELRGGTDQSEDIRDVSFAHLRVGMVFAEDVVLRSGTLLAARGFEISESFLERARNFQSGLNKETVRVVVRDGAESKRVA